MKRQVIFDEHQLYEIVNESARRTLRGLMNESIWGNIRRWFDSDYMDDYLDEYGGGNEQTRAILQQMGPDAVKKLAGVNPEAFKALAQNPNMLAQIANTPGGVDQIVNDPSIMQQMMTGGQGMDPSMGGYPGMGPGMGQMPGGAYPMDGSRGFFGRMADKLRGMLPPQYTDEQASMMLQGINDVDMQIGGLEQQIAQMKKANPNDPMLAGLQANLTMLQNQKQMYQPYLQGYYGKLNKDYNDMMMNMRSGRIPFNPQTMQQLNGMQQKLMMLNQSSAYQYMQPNRANMPATPTAPGTPAQPNPAAPGAPATPAAPGTPAAHRGRQQRPAATGRRRATAQATPAPAPAPVAPAETPAPAPAPQTPAAQLLRNPAMPSNIVGPSRLPGLNIPVPDPRTMKLPNVQFMNRPMR